MSGDGVAAGGRIRGIDLGGRIFSGNLAAIAGPGIGDRVLGVEVAGSDGRGDGLAHHHCSRLHGATRGWRYRRSATPPNDDSALQPKAVLIVIKGADGRVAVIAKAGIEVFGLDGAQGEFLVQL